MQRQGNCIYSMLIDNIGYYEVPSASTSSLSNAARTFLALKELPGEEFTIWCRDYRRRIHRRDARGAIVAPRGQFSLGHRDRACHAPPAAGLLTAPNMAGTCSTHPPSI